MLECDSSWESVANVSVVSVRVFNMLGHMLDLSEISSFRPSGLRKVTAGVKQMWRTTLVQVSIKATNTACQ